MPTPAGFTGVHALEEDVDESAATAKAKGIEANNINRVAIKPNINRLI